MFPIQVWELKESGKSGSTGGVEIKSGDFELFSNGQSRGAEHVDNESRDFVCFGDFLKRMESVGGVEADKLEGNGGTAAAPRHVDGNGWEAAKGDRWVGMGDRCEVRDDGWCVPKAGCEENGDRKLVVWVLKDEFA